MRYDLGRSHSEMKHIGHMGNTHISQMADVMLTRTCYNARCTYRRCNPIPAWVVEPTVARERYPFRSPYFPPNGVGQNAAVKRIKGLASRPTPDEMEAQGESWRPWRAVAARLLWHHYLSRPKRSSDKAPT